MKGHARTVLFAAFSPDEKKVLTASEDQTARVWDAATGKELLLLRGHEDKVRYAAWSPDGKRIINGSEDSTARLWDADKGEESVTMKHGKHPIHFVAFLPDGLQVLTCEEGSARLWPVDPLAISLQRKPRELTPEERRQPADSIRHRTTVPNRAQRIHSPTDTLLLLVEPPLHV